MKVRALILTKADCAGSGQRYAEAYRSQGGRATLVSFSANAYGYPVDVLASVNDLEPVQRMIDAADVVHLKGDHLPSDFQGLELSHKPIAITVGGSGVRRAADPTKPEPHAQQWHALVRYRMECDAVGAITPDLLYPELDAAWVPHATRVHNRWRAPEREIIIGHSPSGRRTKGTDNVFVPAMKMLEAMGFPVRPLIIEKVSNVECIALKSQCHIFFDQARIPAYGLSAVEAMSMGVPVVTYMPPPEQAAHLDVGHGCPIVRFTQPTADAAYKALERLMDVEHLATVHRRTLRYVKRVHGYRAVVGQLHMLYRAAIERFKQRRGIAARGRRNRPMNQTM